MSRATQTVDGYLAALPDDERAALQGLRWIIKATVPESRRAHGLRHAGLQVQEAPTDLPSARRRNTCAIDGARPEGFEEELKPYDTSRGTIRFAPEKPLPEALVEKLVEARVAEIELGAKGYKQRAYARQRHDTFWV